MNWKLFILSIFISCICFKIINSAENRNVQIPWVIQGSYVYYIEIRPNYNLLESREKCKVLGMNHFKQGSVQELSQIINRIYGDGLELWAHRIKMPSTLHVCYKLNTKTGRSVPEDCSTRLALICQTHHNGGTLFYKNGSTIAINQNEVQSVCDPHKNDYDETLELCVIKPSRQP